MLATLDVQTTSFDLIIDYKSSHFLRTTIRGTKVNKYIGIQTLLFKIIPVELYVVHELKFKFYQNALHAEFFTGVAEKMPGW